MQNLPVAKKYINLLFKLHQSLTIVRAYAKTFEINKRTFHVLLISFMLHTSNVAGFEAVFPRENLSDKTLKPPMFFLRSVLCHSLKQHSERNF